MFHRVCIFAALLLSRLMLFAQLQELPVQLFDKAELFRQNSQRDSAAHYYIQAAELFNSLEEYQRAAESFNQAGAMLNRLDQYDVAVIYLGRAYSLGHCGAADSLTLATTHVNLGVTYNALENFDLSLAHHFKALAIRYALLDTLHRDVATSHGNIGNVYYNAGNYDSAVYHHEMAFLIRKNVYGEQSPELIQSYLGMGNASSELGNYADAENCFQAALSLKLLQLEGKETRDLAKYYDLLAEVNQLMGHENSYLHYQAEAARLRAD